MPLLHDVKRALPAAAAGLALLLAGCGQPDTRALQRLACEQAGANLDLQSLSQLDALRKALGLAPDVDPIGYCRSIGVRLEPAPAESGTSSEAAEPSP